MTRKQVRRSHLARMAETAQKNSSQPMTQMVDDSLQLVLKWQTVNHAMTQSPDAKATQRFTFRFVSVRYNKKPASAMQSVRIVAPAYR